jgi:hypothetical protein
MLLVAPGIRSINNQVDFPSYRFFGRKWKKTRRYQVLGVDTDGMIPSRKQTDFSEENWTNDEILYCVSSEELQTSFNIVKLNTELRLKIMPKLSSLTRM